MITGEAMNRSRLCARRWVFVADIVPGPMRIPAVGPGGHFLFLKLSIPFLQNNAKLCPVALNLSEILIRNLIPFRLQRCFELIPELSELFLIHDELLQ